MREIDRERRIPIRKTLGLRDAGIVRSEAAVTRHPAHRHDRADREVGGPGLQAGHGIPQVVIERDPIAWRRVQLPREPRVQHDRLGPARPTWRRPGWNDLAEIRGGDKRIRDRPLALANRVGEIREDRNRPKSELRANLARRAFQLRIDDAGLRVERERDRATPIVHGRDPDAQILEPERVVQGAVRVADSGEQHRVDLARHAKVALEPAERREDGADFRLLRLEREFAEPIRRQHARRLEPQRAADVLLLTEQRFNRDLRRLLHARQQRVARLHPELARQCGRQIHAVRLGHAVKGPEARVDSVDQHAGGAAPGLFVGDRAGRDDQRRGRRTWHASPQVVSDRLRERSRPC